MNSLTDIKTTYSNETISSLNGHVAARVVDHDDRMRLLQRYALKAVLSSQ